MEITLKDIEENLEKLPTELLTEVNDYINFLKDSISKDIPQWQKEEVLRRKRELENKPDSSLSLKEMNTILNKL